MNKNEIIAIVCEGGVIQSIVTNNKNLEGKELLVIDYDTEDAQEDEQLIGVPQGKPIKEDAEAYVYRVKVTRAKIGLKTALKRLECLEEKYADG